MYCKMPIERKYIACIAWETTMHVFVRHSPVSDIPPFYPKMESLHWNDPGCPSVVGRGGHVDCLFADGMR